jgi:hypothetical protein
VSFGTPADVLEITLDRNRDYGFGTIVYSTATIFAYYTYWGNANLPAVIGGTGDIRVWWEKAPFMAEMPHIDNYYLIQFGYHVHNLLHQLFWRYKRATYVEMTLHHVIASTLIFFSYYSCMCHIGLFVLMIHDIGDFWLNLAKMMRDMRLGPGWLLDGAVLILVICWVYPRCIASFFTYISWGTYFAMGWENFHNPYLG